MIIKFKFNYLMLTKGNNSSALVLFIKFQNVLKYKKCLELIKDLL